MPHCCPQKQQWVFTSRSGSTLVERRAPVIDERCGPKRSMMRLESTGTWATALPHLSRIQVPPPQRALRQSEKGAAAARTDLLVVAAVRQLVVEPELLLDGREIANHRQRRVWLMA